MHHGTLDRSHGHLVISWKTQCNNLLNEFHITLDQGKSYPIIIRAAFVCLFVCVCVCSLSPPRSFDGSSPNLLGLCSWTSELPLRSSFPKRSMVRRVYGSLSLSTISYMRQPHATQLQKAPFALLLLLQSLLLHCISTVYVKLLSQLAHDHFKTLCDPAFWHSYDGSPTLHELSLPLHAIFRSPAVASDF